MIRPPHPAAPDDIVLSGAPDRRAGSVRVVPTLWPTDREKDAERCRHDATVLFIWIVRKLPRGVVRRLVADLAAELAIQPNRPPLRVAGKARQPRRHKHDPSRGEG